jgi:hypothetical protein
MSGNDVAITWILAWNQPREFVSDILLHVGIRWWNEVPWEFHEESLINYGQGVSKKVHPFKFKLAITF